MAENFPGLIQKGQMFYFRLAIPRKFWDIARCKEISSSLNTTNYQEAVFKWKSEFTHLQKFINVFEEIIMKINENGKLILTENDVDKVLLYRLGQIQHFLEENTIEIEKGEKGIENIRLYDPKDKNTDKVKDLMQYVIVSYIRDIVESHQANITLRTIYSKLKTKELELGLSEKNDSNEEWFKSFSTHMHSLEKYTEHAVTSIQKDRTYKPSNPKVVSLLQTYDSVKTVERITAPMSRTSWKKLFKRFAENKKNRKGATDRTLHRNYMSIQLMFGLLEKDYVEEITKYECRKLCELVYKVPKKWHQVIKSDKEIPSLLTNNPNKAIKKKTVKGILLTAREFLRFAAKEDIIPTGYGEFFDMPIRLDQRERKPFDSKDLRKIFNPKVYPDPHSRFYMPNFWVPIIALYQGCRCGEICQLDTDDVVSYKKIPCFDINENSKDKSVKNWGTARIIPIHPQLIKMGFLSYVQYRKQEHYKKLFFDKIEKEPGNYRKKITTWFPKYKENVGITEAEKVFHSFRHTFATCAIEKRIPTEYQNALGGWVDHGIGQRIYGKKRDIRIMLEELSKINYPIQAELKELEAKFRDCYVMRWLKREAKFRG